MTAKFYQFIRHELHDKQGNSADRCLTAKKKREKPFYAVLSAGTDVVADYRYASRGHAYDDGNNDLKDFHDDPDDRHRYL